MRIAIVSRELFPLSGGGIGQYVTGLAAVLGEIAEVTIFTTSGYGGILRAEFERLQAAGDPRLPAACVVFVEEPTLEEIAGWYHVMHLYSSRVWERLREVYDELPPDLIEFPDYLGEGFITLQAACVLHPWLARTRISVRLHTTEEQGEVLNGFCKPDLSSRVVHELERFSLRHADRVLWGGGDVMASYRRFYGLAGVAREARVRHPFRGAVAADGGEVLGVADRRVRFLYAGRLERRKGVLALVRAALGLGRDDFALTLVGSDTGTGPLGVSVREMLALEVVGDERVQVLEGVAREELAGLIASHDVVVVPSLWECWPYAALEALHLNRPVLGTPVGGLVEMVVQGRSGWLAPGTGAGDLAAAVERVLDGRGELEALVRSGAPVAHARALCDEGEIRVAYERLARESLARPVHAARRARREPALVSVVVPYFRASRFVAATVESVLAQTYPRLELVVVNDGSFEPEDWVLGELSARRLVRVVTQTNQGLGAARNFGISQTRGRYVFPLDADNVAEPEFVARCVEVLEARPELAYVTAWSRYILEDGSLAPGPDEGYEPLGNQCWLVAEENVAGDAAAVIPRAIFDAGFTYSEELTSFEDWQLYHELHLAGRHGAVIPERLLRYRVRADSMQAQIAHPNRRRLRGEMLARIKQNATPWTSPPA